VTEHDHREAAAALVTRHGKRGAKVHIREYLRKYHSGFTVNDIRRIESLIDEA
jgi:hypothetical protein